MEVGFQKGLHTLDAKKRTHLYRMNFLSVEDLVENLSIFLDTSSVELGVDVHFPTKDEIFEKLSKPHMNQRGIVNASHKNRGQTGMTLRKTAEFATADSSLLKE